MKAIQSVVAALALLVSGNTFAAHTLYFFESGGDVIASGSGSLNVTALAPAGSGPLLPIIIPGAALVFTGPAGTGNAYAGISGPSTLGAGFGVFPATTASGDIVGLDGGMFPGFVFTPASYVSGSPLATSATWPATTLAGMDLTPGTYTWTWGTGSSADSYTIHVGVTPPSTAIPTLSEWGRVALLVLMAGVGFATLAVRHRPSAR